MLIWLNQEEFAHAMLAMLIFLTSVKHVLAHVKIAKQLEQHAQHVSMLIWLNQEVYAHAMLATLTYLTFVRHALVPAKLVQLPEQIVFYVLTSIWRNQEVFVLAMQHMLIFPMSASLVQALVRTAQLIRPLAQLV